MLGNIGLFSYGVAALAYTLLSLVVLANWRERSLGWPLLVASIATALWAILSALSTLPDSPLYRIVHLAEIVRNAAWCFLLLRLISGWLHGKDTFLASGRWRPAFVIGFLGIATLLVLPALPFATGLTSNEFYKTLSFSAWLAMSVLGLLLLEQLFRNSTESERWSIKHLCIGLGVLFVYDFFLYAEGLLFRELDLSMWQSRGAVTAVAAGFLAVAANRFDRERHSPTILVSRHVAFHSVTLLAAGLYLVAMALVGYFIRYLGGSWGGVLQIVFLCAAALLLLALLFSGKIRAQLRVWLNKNFFSYKYDYRTEWLQFTQTLATGEDNIPQNIARAIANLTRSPAGLLWSRSETGRFDLEVNWEMPEPDSDQGLAEMAQWLQQTQWVIDLEEWHASPDLYEGFQYPAFLDSVARAWLIIPLMLGDRLQGILLLRESAIQVDINWEDRDLLKVAGRQAASYLAQYQVNRALVEARQFEAFNRLSAYVIHDLKNILAQQSLIVSNAEKHKDNPAFIEDMIDTVQNSVERMTRLMEQMRSGERDSGMRKVALCDLLRAAIGQRERNEPRPVLAACDERVLVELDGEHLTTVFTHLLQNAQEATPRDGEVRVSLAIENEGQAVVEISDTGSGMDEDFLRNRLFKPFDSTKGLTGMGIGAFESREFVRSIGGDIRVTSTPGEGSVFRIVLPCALYERASSHAENLTG